MANELISIPTPAQCLQLMDRYCMMGHIREHCRKVAAVAVLIADCLANVGERVNVPLLKAAGLLHDIAKIRAIETGEDHAELGASILEDCGFPAVAAIVRGHVRLLGPVSGTPLTETEIVNYADKRVLHTTIVSRTERFEYIRRKYGHNDAARLERIVETEEMARGLEMKIFANLPIGPEDIEASADF